MVLEFLKKQQEELIAKKIELEEDYEFILSKIKENEKFIDLLDEEESTFFSDFTPRNINEKNKMRIKELNQVLIQLNQDKINIEKQMDKINGKLHECQSAIREYKVPDISCETKVDVDELKKISSYIISDPRRAKIELDYFIDEIMLRELKDERE